MRGQEPSAEIQKISRICCKSKDAAESRMGRVRTAHHQSSERVRSAHPTPAALVRRSCGLSCTAMRLSRGSANQRPSMARSPEHIHVGQRVGRNKRRALRRIWCFFSRGASKSPGAARRLVTFLEPPRKVTKRSGPWFAGPADFPALLCGSQGEVQTSGRRWRVLQNIFMPGSA